MSLGSSRVAVSPMASITTPLIVAGSPRET
jgi:hypothetical protein